MKTKKRGARKKKSQRPATGYNILPTKVTREEFNRFIKPYLTTSTRQKPKLSYVTIFNHILYVLHTGIQWANLPEKRVHWSRVYTHFNRWSKDGSFERIFDASLDSLAKEKKIDMRVLHGDGSNVVAKKGASASATRGTNTSRAKKALISKTTWATASSSVSPRV